MNLLAPEKKKLTPDHIQSLSKCYIYCIAYTKNVWTQKITKCNQQKLLWREQKKREMTRPVQEELASNLISTLLSQT